MEKTTAENMSTNAGPTIMAVYSHHTPRVKAATLSHSSRVLLTCFTHLFYSRVLLTCFTRVHHRYKNNLNRHGPPPAMPLDPRSDSELSNTVGSRLMVVPALLLLLLEVLPSHERE